MRAMKQKNTILAFTGTLLLLGGFFGYRYYVLNEELKERNALFEATVADFTARVTDLEIQLEGYKKENQGLVEALIEQVGKNELITGELHNLSNTVKDYEKLNSIDPELLQKYSKVFFLNENYVPSATTTIDQKYLARTSTPVEIHAKVWPFLELMLRHADEQSVPLQIISGYRSFGTQSTLKSSYKVTYGAGTANQFSAEQGYSEHQLATTIDFTTPDIGLAFTRFESTLSYTWLLQNAHKYGFVLSYPKGNTYYVFEPWHWRFVGVELATKLFNENKHFYDLDQRELDQYLIKIFD